MGKNDLRVSVLDRNSPQEFLQSIPKDLGASQSSCVVNVWHNIIGVNMLKRCVVVLAMAFQFSVVSSVAYSHSKQDCLRELQVEKMMCFVFLGPWLCDMEREKQIEICNDPDHTHNDTRAPREDGDKPELNGDDP